MKEREERIAEFRRRQPRAELARKAVKAISRSNIWSQEEFDEAYAEGFELYQAFKGRWE